MSDERSAERGIVPRQSDLDSVAPRAIIEASGFTSLFPIQLRRLNNALALADPPKKLETFEISLFPHLDHPIFNTNVRFAPNFQVDINSYPKKEYATVDVVYIAGGTTAEAKRITRKGLLTCNFRLRDVQEFINSVVPEKNVALIGVPNEYSTDFFSKRKRRFPLVENDFVAMTEQELKSISEYTLGNAVEWAEKDFQTRDQAKAEPEYTPKWGDPSANSFNLFFDFLQLRLEGQDNPLFSFPNANLLREDETILVFNEFHFQGLPRDVETAVIKLADLFEKTPSYQENLRELSETE